MYNTYIHIFLCYRKVLKYRYSQTFLTSYAVLVTVDRNISRVTLHVIDMRNGEREVSLTISIDRPLIYSNMYSLRNFTCLARERERFVHLMPENLHCSLNYSVTRCLSYARARRGKPRLFEVSLIGCRR